MPEDKPKNKSFDKGQQKPKVQSLLAARNSGQGQSVNFTNPSKEKPYKQKRTVSELSNESMEKVEVMTILEDLDEIKQSLQDTIKKSDLDKSLDCLVKQNDLKEMVTTIVNQLLISFKENLTREFDDKLRERTGKLHDKIDGLAIENEQLRESIRVKEKVIESLKDKVEDAYIRSTEALKQSNHNEQYSRKHNIRVINYPEKTGEDLTQDFINLVKNDLDVTITKDEVIAIHRIPGKPDLPRPVLVKVKNTEVKSRMMRQKKNLKQYVKFNDDITQKNLGLMTRLSKSDRIFSAWFFNDSVYAKTSKEGRRIRFDIYDNIDEKLNHHQEKEHVRPKTS